MDILHNMACCKRKWLPQIILGTPNDQLTSGLFSSELSVQGAIEQKCLDVGTQAKILHL